MTLKPKPDSAVTGYPTSIEYNRRMRQLLACLAVAGTGVAVDDLAADEPKRDTKKEGAKKDDKKGTAETDKKLVLEKVRKEIKENADKLGGDSFKVRREATKRLIAIGSVTEAPKTGKSPRRLPNKKTMPYRSFVIEAMKELASHKDPEVKERAKLVIKALTPKPVRIAPPMRLGGDIAVEQVEIIEEVEIDE